MNLRRMIGIAAATLGVAAMGIGVSPMSVSAGERVAQVEDCQYDGPICYGENGPVCIDPDWRPEDDSSAQLSSLRIDTKLPYCQPEREPDPCPFDPSILVGDPNCVFIVTTTTPPPTTQPEVPTTTVESEGPAPVATDGPTTTQVESAGPVPAAPAVLPATGSSDLPLVIAGSMALLLGVGMVRIARSGVR
jgi:hypothetical protein